MEAGRSRRQEAALEGMNSYESRCEESRAPTGAVEDRSYKAAVKE